MMPPFYVHPYLVTLSGCQISTPISPPIITFFVGGGGVPLFLETTTTQVAIIRA